MEKMAIEDRGKNWCDAASSPGNTMSHQKLKRQRRTVPWSLQRKCGPALTLILDFGLQDVWPAGLFKATVCDHLWQLQEAITARNLVFQHLSFLVYKILRFFTELLGGLNEKRFIKPQTSAWHIKIFSKLLKED